MMMERKGSILSKESVQKEPNIPSITMSPCAMFMMCMTPKMMVRPMPIIA